MRKMDPATVSVDHFGVRADMVMRGGQPLAEALAPLLTYFYIAGWVPWALLLAIVNLVTKPKQIAVIEFKRWRPVGNVPVLLRLEQSVLLEGQIRPVFNYGFAASSSTSHAVLVRLVIIANRRAAGKYTVILEVDQSDAFTRNVPTLVAQAWLAAGADPAVVLALLATLAVTQTAVSPALGCDRRAIKVTTATQQGCPASGPAYRVVTEEPLAELAADLRKDGNLSPPVLFAPRRHRLGGTKCMAGPTSPVEGYADDTNLLTPPSAKSIAWAARRVQFHLSPINKITNANKLRLSLYSPVAASEAAVAATAKQLQADALAHCAAEEARGRGRPPLPADCAVFLDINDVGFRFSHSLNFHLNFSRNAGQAQA